MILINGREFLPDKPLSAAEYLQQKGYKTDRVVVELNGEILPKASYGSTVFRDGDRVEILSFVGGG